MILESQSLKATKMGWLPLARFQPAYKLVTVFVFTVCVSLLASPYIALIANLFPFLLAIMACLPIKALYKKLIPVNFFFIFLWIFLPLTIVDGHLSFTYSGVVLATLITFKGNAIAAMLLVLVGTSTINETCRGLLTLRLSEKLVTLLLLTYNNLSCMMDEYKKIFIAAKLRGFNSTRTLSGYKIVAYLVGMLLVKSWQKAQRVNNAMYLRGFSGKYPLLEVQPETPYSQYSKLFLSCLLLVSITLLFADIMS